MTSGNDLQALLSAYIDGEHLDAHEQRSVADALSAARPLQRDVALQSATRNLVRNRTAMLRQQAPESLLHAIRAGLDEADASPAKTQSRRTAWSLGDAWKSLWASPKYVRGLVAMGTVAVVVFVALLLVKTPTASPELSSLAYEQFTKLSAEAFPVDMASSDPTSLRSYFASRGVEYDVFFPEVHATLRGGSVVTINGRKCAQLVYTAGSKYMYLVEVDDTDIQSGAVQLDEQIAEDVALSRWHWEERSDVGTMFVWKSNNVMCTAVSDMPTSEFSALFRLETL